jgi:uncharacterized membrane protein (DUF106 family)
MRRVGGLIAIDGGGDAMLLDRRAEVGHVGPSHLSLYGGRMTHRRFFSILAVIFAPFIWLAMIPLTIVLVAFVLLAIPFVLIAGSFADRNERGGES